MKIAVIDIDGVLCRDEKYEDNPNYLHRKPLERGLEAVRHLRGAGYIIILHTARRPADRSVTECWLHKYEVKYDQLITGKPRGDIYIDDRGFKFESTEECLNTLKEISNE